MQRMVSLGAGLTAHDHGIENPLYPQTLAYIMELPF
jgi:hypothetical protein